jgi:hypothetical protein
MEFDLEIVLPICSQGKYRQRYEDFKKYGLREIGPYKILLTLLTGTETFHDIDKGWPDNVTVRQFGSPSNHCVAKVYWYYTHYDPNDIEKSRWFMRVDDDSMTHISNLMDCLRTLDADDEYYLTTERFCGETGIELEILEKFNILDCLKGNYYHEFEASIMSRRVFRILMADPLSQKIFQERATIEKGWTDICVAFAAKILGIQPFPFKVLSKDPLMEDFIAGRKCHIHFVARDNFNQYSWLVQQPLAKNQYPKEIVEQAKIRAYRVHVDYLVTGCPRSGTVYMARVMGTLGIPTGHEAVFKTDGINGAIARLDRKLPIECSEVSKIYWDGMVHKCPNWFSDEASIIADASYMAAPYLDHEALTDTQVIHVVRDPVKVVNSLCNYFGYFINPYPTDLRENYIYESFIYSHVPLLAADLTQYERAALFYVEWNEMIERKSPQLFRYRVEDPVEPLCEFLDKAWHPGIFQNRLVNSRAAPCRAFTLNDLAGEIKDRFVSMGRRYGYPMRDREYFV